MHLSYDYHIIYAVRLCLYIFVFTPVMLYQLTKKNKEAKKINKIFGNVL